MNALSMIAPPRFTMTLFDILAVFVNAHCPHRAAIILIPFWDIVAAKP